MEDTSKLSSLEIKEVVVDGGKVEDAVKTYHFKRSDGSYIAVQEQEAWNIINGRTQIVGFRHAIPQLVGVSDGQIFQRAVLESHGLIRDGKVAEARALLEKAKDEEREAGMGKIEMPRNFDTIDQRGRPVKISDLR